ncbi:MAG: hypothetical protein H0T42_29225 [Deltaproteobacteria bacterium]|nr:hypothetical protein [Deltaproteobacteria bacterium]
MQAILVFVAACGSGSDGVGAIDAFGAPPGGLTPGTLMVSWMHGSQSCGANTDPEARVHAAPGTTPPAQPVTYDHLVIDPQ